MWTRALIRWIEKHGSEKSIDVIYSCAIINGEIIQRTKAVIQTSSCGIVNITIKHPIGMNGLDEPNHNLPPYSLN